MTVYSVAGDFSPAHCLPWFFTRLQPAHSGGQQRLALFCSIRHTGRQIGDELFRRGFIFEAEVSQSDHPQVSQHKAMIVQLLDPLQVQFPIPFLSDGFGDLQPDQCFLVQRQQRRQIAGRMDNPDQS